MEFAKRFAVRNWPLLAVAALGITLFWLKGWMETVMPVIAVVHFSDDPVQQEIAKFTSDIAVGYVTHLTSLAAAAIVGNGLILFNKSHELTWTELCLSVASAFSLLVSMFFSTVAYDTSLRTSLLGMWPSTSDTLLSAIRMQYAFLGLGVLCLIGNMLNIVVRGRR